MHAAPAVQVETTPATGCRRAGEAALRALAAAVATAWASAWLGGGAGATAAAALAAGALAAALTRPAAPPRRLRWDGARWTCAALDGRLEQAGTVEPALDFGAWLLLRFRPQAPGATQWLLVGRSTQAASWPGLRAAVFAASGGDAMTAR